MIALVFLDMKQTCRVSCRSAVGWWDRKFNEISNIHWTPLQTAVFSHLKEWRENFLCLLDQKGIIHDRWNGTRYNFFQRAIRSLLSMELILIRQLSEFIVWFVCLFTPFRLHYRTNLTVAFIVSSNFNVKFPVVTRESDYLYLT